MPMAFSGEQKTWKVGTETVTENWGKVLSIVYYSSIAHHLMYLKDMLIATG